MLTARNVIVITVAIAVLSLVGATLSLLKPLDQGGLGEDTYGTRAGGYRAIFDVLAALGLEVDRALVPPNGVLDRPVTLVLWGSQDDLVRTEPIYLQEVGKWVRAGGRVVVAPQATRERNWRPEGFRGLNEFVKDTTAIEELGLPRINTELVDVSLSGAASDGSRAAKRDHPDSADAKEKSVSATLQDLLNPQLFATRLMEVKVEGDLASLAAQVNILEVPEQLQVLQLGDTKPSGRILATNDDRRSLVLAARYQLGAGEVTLIGDPAVFDNRLLSHGDNAVLAVDLLAGAGRPVVWDEFYHGLTIRGNPLFLLTRPAYAILAAMIVMTTAAWVWRQALFLGPPLATAAPSRRTVGEYVEAVARLFSRGSDSRRFMLAEMRRGALWTLRRKFGSRRDRDIPDAVVAAIARHDPQAARRLADAVAAADRMISGPSRINDREILRAAKELADCL